MGAYGVKPIGQVPAKINSVVLLCALVRSQTPVVVVIEQQYETPPPTALGAQVYEDGQAFTVPIVHGTGMLLSKYGVPVPQMAKYAFTFLYS